MSFLRNIMAVEQSRGVVSSLKIPECLGNCKTYDSKENPMGLLLDSMRVH